MPESFTLEQVLRNAVQDGYIPEDAISYPHHKRMDKNREVLMLMHTEQRDRGNHCFTYCTKDGFLLSLPQLVQSGREISLVCPRISYGSATEAEKLYQRYKDIEKIRSFLSSVPKD